MPGLSLLSSSLSELKSGSGKKSKSTIKWQYHPRSDYHAKVSCFAVLLDFFLRSSLARAHAQQGKIAIGVNREILNPATGQSRTIPFVIQRVNPRENLGKTEKKKTFAQLAETYSVILDEETLIEMDSLPEILVSDSSNAPVLLALEVKACMTEHGKSKSRLFDELNSLHHVVHRSSASSMAAALVLLNSSDTFISPIRNPQKPKGTKGWEVTEHPVGAAQKLAEHLTKIPLSSVNYPHGLDSFGMLFLDCKNDGSPVQVAATPKSVPHGFHYSEFLVGLENSYAMRFQKI